MKIHNLSGSSCYGDVTVSVNFAFDSGTSLSSAIAAVESLVSGVAVSRDTSAPSPTSASVASEPVADTGASTARTRRSRTAPASTPTTPTADTPAVDEAPAATVTDIGTRRRRAAASEAGGPKVYSDVDLSKAASNTAARLVELGDKGGPDIVKLVLADFGVKSTSDIPQDQREKFLKDLAEEVKLAEADRAAQDAEAASA